MTRGLCCAMNWLATINTKFIQRHTKSQIFVLLRHRPRDIRSFARSFCPSLINHRGMSFACKPRALSLVIDACPCSVRTSMSRMSRPVSRSKFISSRIFPPRSFNRTQTPFAATSKRTDGTKVSKDPNRPARQTKIGHAPSR